DMKIDTKMWQAYREPFFRFSRELTCREFAIITAWNPRSQLMSNEYNRIKNNALERRLRHYSYVSVLVGDAQFCWAEESFAAALPLVKALSLGREFAQNAIYYVRDGELLLFSCQGTQKEHLGALTSRCCE
ncbi:DUF3293 domain-containing protein, partial [Vibrio sp. V37_P2S8PM304]